MKKLALLLLINSCSSEDNYFVEDPIVEMSLTMEGFPGKKYYMGWGVAGRGDPNMMHLEVSSDVKHTHEIFSKDVGGNYESYVKTGLEVNGSYIKDTWEEIKDLTNKEDMYIQYSSGHGSPTGLGAGVSYKEIADYVLSLDVEERVVFIMACYSGGLTEEFERRKSEWGKGDLFVLASSKRSESSSTGPSSDPEADGPRGSAGSAYGHSLWKALLGDSDGFVDGVEDNYISLEEIAAYTTYLTKRLGGHTPQLTGQFDGMKIMSNRIRQETFMFNDLTGDDFFHVYQSESDSFIISKKDEIREFDRHALYVVKPDFEISKNYTDLKAAKEMCEKLLELMGVKTYYKEDKMALMFEVVKLEKEEGGKQSMKIIH